MAGQEAEGHIKVDSLIRALKALVKTAESATRLAATGRSGGRGAKPRWLKAALDFTVTGLEAGSARARALRSPGGQVACDACDPPGSLRRCPAVRYVTVMAMSNAERQRRFRGRAAKRAEARAGALRRLEAEAHDRTPATWRELRPDTLGGRERAAYWLGRWSALCDLMEAQEAQDGP